jgi:hypothetical protein
MSPKGPESYRVMISGYVCLSGPSRLPVCNAAGRIALEKNRSQTLSTRQESKKEGRGEFPNPLCVSFG